MSFSKLVLPFVLLTAACGPAPEALPDADRPAMNEDALVLAEGAFAPKVHQAKGGVRLEDADGARRALFTDDFEIDNGPALVVFLSPTPFADLTPDNALDGRLSIGDLAAVRGAQEYALGDDVVVDDFQSIVVWCESFGVLYAAAGLEHRTAE